MFWLTDDPELNQMVMTHFRASPKLKKHAEIAESTARRAIYLKPDLSKKPTIGTTKINGLPDLPPSVPYPVGERGLFVFHAQLNLTDLVSFQGFLPRTGMLWFFTSDQEFDDKMKARIIYDSGDIGRLSPFQIPDGKKFYGENYQLEGEHPVTPSAGPSFYWDVDPEGFDILFPGLRARLGYTDNDYFEFLDAMHQDLNEEGIGIPLHAEGPGAYNVHQLNGHVSTHESCAELQASSVYGGPPNDWVNLLSLQSIAGRTVWDQASLTFTVKLQDLSNEDFSTVAVSMVTC